MVGRKTDNQIKLRAGECGWLGAKIRFGKALRRGEVKKPIVCDDCGKGPPTQPTWADYSEPLDVQWLCPKCFLKPEAWAVDDASKNVVIG
jgi:hypothetical protein